MGALRPGFCFTRHFCCWMYVRPFIYPTHQLLFTDVITVYLLQVCKSAVILHDYLLNSVVARALKPPLAKPALASIKLEAQNLAKSIQKTAAERSRASREVTEADIDA